MGQEKIRVIQWATGAVGAEAIQIMAERPGLELPPIPPSSRFPAAIRR